MSRLNALLSSEQTPLSSSRVDAIWASERQALEEALSPGLVRKNQFSTTKLDSLVSLAKQVSNEAWGPEKKLVTFVGLDEHLRFGNKEDATFAVATQHGSYPFILALYFQTTSRGTPSTISPILIPMVENDKKTGFDLAEYEGHGPDVPKSFVNHDFMLHLVRHPDEHVGLQTSNAHLEKNNSHLVSVALFSPTLTQPTYEPYAVTHLASLKEVVDRPHASKTKSVLVRLIPALLLMTAIVSLPDTKVSSAQSHHVDTLEDWHMYKYKHIGDASLLIQNPEAAKFKDIMDHNGVVTELAHDPKILTHIQADLDDHLTRYLAATSEAEKEAIQAHWQIHPGRKMLEELVEEEHKIDRSLSSPQTPADLFAYHSPSKSLERDMKDYVAHLSSADAIAAGSNPPPSSMLDTFLELNKVLSAHAVLKFYGGIDYLGKYLGKWNTPPPKAAKMKVFENLVEHVRVKLWRPIFEYGERVDQRLKDRQENAREKDTLLRTLGTTGAAVAGAGNISAALSGPRSKFEDWYLTHADTPPLHRSVAKGNTKLPDWMTRDDERYWEFEVPFEMIVTGIHLVHPDKTFRTYLLRLTGYFKKVELYEGSGENGHFADTKELVVVSASLVHQTDKEVEKAMKERESNRSVVVVKGT